MSRGDCLCSEDFNRHINVTTKLQPEDLNTTVIPSQVWNHFVRDTFCFLETDEVIILVWSRIINIV